MNKDDVLYKASEVPGILYEALDELRDYSKNKQSNEKRILDLELKLSNQKYLIIVIGIVIMVSVAIMIIVS